MSEKTKDVTFVILVVLFLVGLTTVLISGRPATEPEIDQPSVIVETLDASLEQFVPAWKAEIGRRFPHAVGILVHGGDFVEGQWIVGTNLSPHRVTPVQEVVSHYQHLYPGRTVVLLACNTGHLHLNMPGVYYARSSVWCVPDRALQPATLNEANDTFDGAENRWAADSDVVGNIYEFVHD